MISKVTLKSLIFFGLLLSTSLNAQDNCTTLDSDNKCVVFDISESAFKEGAQCRYLWEFGDGFTGEGEKVEHCYKSYGSYKAKLKVVTTTASNNTYTDEEVYDVDLNELVSIYEKREEINKYYFDGSESFIDNGIEIKQYYWTFGDGSNAEGKVTFHEFALPGTYEVLLTVNGINSEGNPISVCGKKNIAVK